MVTRLSGSALTDWSTTVSEKRYPFEAEWAWLAGILDGEGHISMVTAKRGTLVRRLAITSTNLPMLIRVGERFGGKIHAHRPAPPKHRQQFQWYTYGDHLRVLLHGMLPYLTVKREEAEIYLAFDARVQPGRWGSRLKTHEREHRMELLARVQVIRKLAWLPTDVPVEFRPTKRAIRVE